MQTEDDLTIIKAEELPKEKTQGVLMFIALAGLGLILNGTIGNAAHEVYAAVNYCAGWGMVSAAMILDRIR